MWKCTVICLYYSIYIPESKRMRMLGLLRHSDTASLHQITWTIFAHVFCPPNNSRYKDCSLPCFLSLPNMHCYVGFCWSYVRSNRALAVADASCYCTEPVLGCNKYPWFFISGNKNRPFAAADKCPDYSNRFLNSSMGKKGGVVQLSQLHRTGKDAQYQTNQQWVAKTIDQMDAQ